jgi:carbamoylphosphate synthase small subunit
MVNANKIYSILNGAQDYREASPGPQDGFYLFEKFVGGLG